MAESCNFDTDSILNVDLEDQVFDSIFCLV